MHTPILYTLTVSLLLGQRIGAQQIGEACNNSTGECKELTLCPDIELKINTIDLKTINYCDVELGIVCCPKPKGKLNGVESRFGLREPETIAEKECAEYQEKAPRTCSQALIIGGEKAAAKEFQSAALLGIRHKKTGKIQWFCGGTLISKRFVLTAAHCFLRPLDTVRLGELDYNTEDDRTEVQEFNIDHRRAIIHPRYQLDRYNDIALVNLGRDAVFNDYVLPACLPPKDADYDAFTAVGWGNTETGLPSSHLLKVQLEVFRKDECAAVIMDVYEGLDQGLVDKTQLCAGSHVGKSDTCKGDSGGPLYVSHPDYPCMYIVAAITSVGYIKCGTKAIPSLNTRTNLYMGWIENVVWNATASF